MLTARRSTGQWGRSGLERLYKFAADWSVAGANLGRSAFLGNLCTADEFISSVQVQSILNEFDSSFNQSVGFVNEMVK